jgi:hypothetical protein
MLQNKLRVVVGNTLEFHSEELGSTPSARSILDINNYENKV